MDTTTTQKRLRLIRNPRPIDSMPAVTNLAVRVTDRSAWLGAIHAREGHIEGKRPIPFLKSAPAAHAAGFAMSAQEALVGDEPNTDAAIEHLETSIALAIGLLTQLKGAK